MAAVPPQLELTCAAMSQVMDEHMDPDLRRPELRRLKRKNDELKQRNDELTTKITWEQDENRRLYNENQRLSEENFWRKKLKEESLRLSAENDKLRQTARDRSERIDFLETKVITHAIGILMNAKEDCWYSLRHKNDDDVRRARYAMLDAIQVLQSEIPEPSMAGEEEPEEEGRAEENPS